MTSHETEALRQEMTLLTVLGAVIPVFHWCGFVIGVRGLLKRGAGGPLLAGYVLANVNALAAFIVLCFGISTFLVPSVVCCRRCLLFFCFFAVVVACNQGDQRNSDSATPASFVVVLSSSCHFRRASETELTSFSVVTCILSGGAFGELIWTRVVWS